MSRRPNPASDRAAQNAQTLKALVKLEGNKVCADCKKNKHPRWASWNLGVFVCIRCSGIHRGMGTHISRVKSVDLDAWTDEQLQSVLKWGNTRANKYWEAKLAAGHAPSEAKIENFIRTKYESKRWVMDGPMPDPSTLDADDDVPLNIVQEKAKIERSASLKAQAGQPPPIQQPRAPAQNVNLFDDFTPDPPARPSTADIPTSRAPPPPAVRTKPQESLLGLDFFGSQQQGAGIGRPASATSTPASTTNTRGDLKNSILSLYASTPKPQAQSAGHDRQSSFGAMTSAPAPQQDAFGGLTDAFGGMNFANSNTAKPVAPPGPQSQSSGLSGLNFPSAVPAKATPSAPQIASQAPLSGGSFFDTASSKPAPKPAAFVAPKPSDGLDFSFTSVASPPAAPKPQSASVMPADLFADDGFNSFTVPSTVQPAPPPAAPKKPVSASIQSSDFGSAFNLSAPTTSPPKTAPVPARPIITSQPSSAMFDPWGSGADTNAWGAPEPAPAKPAAPKVELGSVPSHITPNDISGGWGAPISSARKSTAQPTVTADEDFGGWTSAPTPGTTSQSKPGGFGGTSDPFDNPWG